jgi:hypothetical protein
VARVEADPKAPTAEVELAGWSAITKDAFAANMIRALVTHSPDGI